MLSPALSFVQESLDLSQSLVSQAALNNAKGASACITVQSRVDAQHVAPLPLGWVLRSHMELSPSHGNLRAQSAPKLLRGRTAKVVSVDAMLRQMVMLNSSGLTTGLFLPLGRLGSGEPLLPLSGIHYFFRKSWPNKLGGNLS